MPSLFKPVEKKGVLSYEEILKIRQQTKILQAKAYPIKLLMDKSKPKQLSLSDLLANLTATHSSLNITTISPGLKTESLNSTESTSSQNITTNPTTNLQTTTTVVGTTTTTAEKSTTTTTKATTNDVCKNLGLGKIHELSFCMKKQVFEPDVRRGFKMICLACMKRIQLIIKF